MKALVATVAVSLLAAGACVSSRSESPDVFEQNRRLGRGVNIIGYDPLWESRDRARFQEKHFRLLKEAGFDNVRVNLQPFRHMKRSANLELPAAWWSTLDWVVSQATKQGLRVILDCHEFIPMGDDAVGNHDKLMSFWRQLSVHCRDASDLVLFEILNEPSKKMTPDLWNQYLAEALSIIRETNPKRSVIVGPAFWNSIDHLPELKLPEDDRRLIVTVHYYDPMPFTHQGAAWASYKDKTGVDWKGTDSERNAVRSRFAKAAEWAKAHNRPLFLGEFGAYDKAPMDARVRYTDCVARTAESFGWSWAYWQFDSDFILWDMKRDAWVEPILRALVPPRAAAPGEKSP